MKTNNQVEKQKQLILTMWFAAKVSKRLPTRSVAITAVMVALSVWLPSAKADPFSWRVVVDPHQKAKFSCEPKEITTTFTARIEGTKQPVSVPGQYIIDGPHWSWAEDANNETSTLTITKTYTAEVTIDTATATATFTCTPDGGACPGGNLTATDSGKVEVTIGSDRFTTTGIEVKEVKAPEVAISATDLGETRPRALISFDITACKVGNAWVPRFTGAVAEYYAKVDFGPSGTKEVTGPPFGNGLGCGLLNANACSCEQAFGLANWGSNKWYSTSAVQAHENIHAGHMGITFQTAVAVALGGMRKFVLTPTPHFEERIGILSLSVPDHGQSQGEAVAEIKALDAYKAAVGHIFEDWTSNYMVELSGDHGTNKDGPAYQAEIPIASGRKQDVCNWRANQNPQLLGCPTCND
jgi:hypothetical protein